MRPPSRAQPTFHESISRIRVGPSSQSSAASPGSHSPRPASSVSSRWSSTLSGSASPRAAATVICAITVAPPRPTMLRSARTIRPAPASAAASAAYMPAPPAPMTSTSAAIWAGACVIACLLRRSLGRRGPIRAAGGARPRAGRAHSRRRRGTRARRRRCGPRSGCPSARPRTHSRSAPRRWGTPAPD